MSWCHRGITRGSEKKVRLRRAVQCVCGSPIQRTLSLTSVDMSCSVTIHLGTGFSTFQVICKAHVNCSFFLEH